MLVFSSTACLGFALMAVVALIVCEIFHSRLGIYLCKPLASTGFVLYALALGASHSAYGQTLLAAFAACWLGDILLMRPGQRNFLWGLLAFLIGQVFFLWAFSQRVAPLPTLTARVVVGTAFGISISVARWLLPHVKMHLWFPILAYLTVITAMVAVAAHMTVWWSGPFTTFGGAFLFYVSDICVARQRLVKPTLVNSLVGLPLYYGAQLLLASTL